MNDDAIEEGSMSERTVLVLFERLMRFLVNGFAAVGDAINEPHVWRSSGAELLNVCAEAVSALARIGRA
ncbi:MAG: hypothetical protein ACYDEY_03185 [Acidimicrobiales bacterium]